MLFSYSQIKDVVWIWYSEIHTLLWAKISFGFQKEPTLV